MWIDTALNPPEIALLPQQDLSGTVCVVFDVLRATTSILNALAHGAAQVIPVSTIEEALAMRVQLPDAILGGERNGERIEGFDLGNSPFDYQENVEGRTIITTTTNGTKALRACAHAQTVAVGAVVNLGKLVSWLEDMQPEKILLVCAGTFETFALEDAYAAGVVAGCFPDADWSDATQAVASVAARFQNSYEAVSTARNGRTLEGKGRVDEVKFCGESSRLDVLGCMKDGIITRLG